MSYRQFRYVSEHINVQQSVSELYKIVFYKLINKTSLTKQNNENTY